MNEINVIPVGSVVLLAGIEATVEEIHLRGRSHEIYYTVEWWDGRDARGGTFRAALVRTDVDIDKQRIGFHA